MFDEFREISEDSLEFDESFENVPELDPVESSGIGFLGMTAGQRFVLSLLLLGTVIILGLTCLMVTERIWLF
jgi:hypothetical protein